MRDQKINMLSTPNPKRRPSVFKRIAVEYCESTTLHGFAYFVRAENGIERLSWIAITVISFVCAGFCISAAIEDWMNDPTTTVIQSFSKVFRAKSLDNTNFDNTNIYHFTASNRS